MAFTFFIVGAGRSGTSLLAAMVDQHPQLRCGMEVESVRCLGQKPGGIFRRDSANARLKCFEKACEFYASQWAFQWGNKLTTEQIGFLDALTGNRSAEAFFSYFSSQKIICVLRDGRSCIPSKMQRKGKTLEEAMISWRKSLDMLEVLQNTCGDRLHILKFEDLLSEPEFHLSGVANFLDVEYHPEMLKGADSPVLPDIYQGQGGLRQDKAKTPLYEGWHSEIEEDLRRWGYIA
jgi:hypothetical protein